MNQFYSSSKGIIPVYETIPSEEKEAFSFVGVGDI